MSRSDERQKRNRVKARKTILVLTVMVAAGAFWWSKARTQRQPARESVEAARPVTGAPIQIAKPSTETSPAAAAALPKFSFPDPSKAPATVRLIVDLKGNARQRFEALHALQRPLNAEELRVLYAFLLGRHEEDEQPFGQVLKNDLMNALLQQEPLPAGLEEMLAQVFRDQNQHVVLRDYAVQYLTALHEQLDAPSMADALATQTQIQQLLWEALAETDSSIAGTALLGLSRLADVHQEIDREKVAAAALQLAGAGSTSDLTQMTAMQVCARLGVQAALPLLVEAAQTGSTALRISAIGALGALGTPAELDLLERTIKGQDEHTKPAAEASLQRLRKRWAQPGA